MQENDDKALDLDNDNEEAEEFANSIDDDELKKPLLTEIARKKHFRDKFQKEQERNEVLEAKVKELSDPDIQQKKEETSEEKVTLETNVSTLMQAEEKRTFGYTNGLSPEETDEIFAYSVGKGISLADAKDSPLMKAALESMREQKKADNATPGASNRAPLFDGKTFSDVVTSEKTSKDEKQKAFESVMSRRGNNSNE